MKMIHHSDTPAMRKTKVIVVKVKTWEGVKTYELIASANGIMATVWNEKTKRYELV